MAGHHDVSHAGHLVHAPGREIKVHAVVVTAAFTPEIPRRHRIAGDDHGQAVAIEAQAVMAQRVTGRWNNIDSVEKPTGRNFDRFGQLVRLVQGCRDLRSRQPPGFGKVRQIKPMVAMLVRDKDRVEVVQFQAGAPVEFLEFKK